LKNERQIFREALQSQLGRLRSRLERPDAGQWRQMGKFAEDFTLWLERARPWMPCASQLIALRVEQIVDDLGSQTRSKTAVRKFVDLLTEAGRHLEQPGLPIQVVDLEVEKVAGVLRKSVQLPSIWPDMPDCGIGLPEGLFEIPTILQPPNDPPTHFRFLIPN
jgi:hypothetical protein